MNDTDQLWTQSKLGGTVKNSRRHGCLTARSVKNGTPLTVAACGGAVGQQWTVPTPLSAPGSHRRRAGSAPLYRK